MDASHIFPQSMVAGFPLFRVLLAFWCPEPVLDAGQGLLFAVWLSLPCQGQDLLPSCWVEALRVRIYWALLPLSACPSPEEVTAVQGSPPRTCTSRAQLSLALLRSRPSSRAFLCCVHPGPSARLWGGSGWGLEPRHCGCRNQGGCASFGDLSCVPGRPLPGPVCPRSSSRWGCGVGGARAFAPLNWEFSQVQVSLP